jgi:Ni/Co efflux regulator RcnB
VPRAYISDDYMIDDYHAYHLRRPPSGHCWIRVDNDFLLTAIATGLVVDILSNRHD